MQIYHEKNQVPAMMTILLFVFFTCTRKTFGYQILILCVLFDFMFQNLKYRVKQNTERCALTVKVNKAFLLSLLMITGGHLYGYNQAVIDDCDYKTAISIQQNKLEQASDYDKGIYAKKLAMLYLKDQDQEHAFEFFLKALELLKTKTSSPPYDEAEYKKAFSIYLDPSSKSPQITANNLIKTLEPVLQKNPDEYILDYFVAIAYANLGKYEEFFNHFSRAYQFYPSHYLAYKTKAVLHIKLLERTSGKAERAAQRQSVLDNLRLALELEPHDTTIYRLLISFSPQDQKCNQVQLCLNKIINGNIMIPRGELMFFVIEAVDHCNFDLAQRFIARAKEWYPQSRIVTSVQNYLDDRRLLR